MIMLLFGVSTLWQNLMACDVCQKNQPKGLEKITHGTGPTGTIDYIIMWSAGILVLVTLFYSIKYLVRPKETEAGHIKNIVLKEFV